MEILKINNETASETKKKKKKPKGGRKEERRYMKIRESVQEISYPNREFPE